MICSFLIGSFFVLIRIIGEDFNSLFSYVTSEYNFHNPSPIILNQFGEGNNVLEECFLREGNLSRVFGLDKVANDFDIINTKGRELKIYLETINNLTMLFPAYNNIIQLLINKTEFITDTSLVYLGYDYDALRIVNLSLIIEALNNAIDEKQPERWNQLLGDQNYECLIGLDPTGSPKDNLLHPWTCEPNKRDWIGYSNDEVKNYAQIVTDIVQLLKKANKTDEDKDNFHNIMNQTKNAYKICLDSYLDALLFFDDVIGDIVNELEEGIGTSNDTFSFLNGTFIKNNIKIFLKYLKYSLGQDINTVGKCLIIIGCFLILSVSITILLLVIIGININLERKKSLNTDYIPSFPSNDGGIKKFQY